MTSSPATWDGSATRNRSVRRGSWSACRRIQTVIAGLQIADTCFYYPEDRGVSESVRLGQEMADRLGKSA